MNRKKLITTACFATLCGGALHGQPNDKTAAFQVFVNNGQPGVLNYRVMADTGGAAVAGHPFAATEERRTLQVLGDGTRIDKTETDKYYRDDMGRTRIERDGGATVIITDPVSGFTAELSTANKTARKTVVMKRVTTTSGQKAPDAAALDKLRAEALARVTEDIAVHVGAGEGSAQGSGGAMTNTMTKVQTFTMTTDSKASAVAQKSTAEDLGTQIINGISAHGTRSTITIPAGQIGNDREIKIVSERWFSNDLQMLVKSSNNDPRFGETTYQLAGVLQGAQDPTLFQIPTDFNVNGLK